MSRSIKRAGKLIRKSVASIEKSFDRMSSTTTSSRAKMTGAAAACVAGLAAVVHYVRARGRADRLHVRHEGAEWALRKDGTNGSVKTFDTKREAVAAAREEGAAAAPREVEDPQPEIDEAARRQGYALSVRPDRRSEIVRKEAT